MVADGVLESSREKTRTKGHRLTAFWHDLGPPKTSRPEFGP
jgi:hypothetical protein